MLTDILIGVIIGIGLERALKVSFMVQRAIKQMKENKKKEAERKKALLEKKDGENIS